MNLKSLTETDIITKVIIPNLQKSNWNINSQIAQERTFTDGKIIVRGSVSTRGARKRADIILFYKPNIPIAIIEAKDNNQTIQKGIQQALDYSEILQIPFVFSSNGDGFLFHDKTGLYGKKEQIIDIDKFPSPEELWEKYCIWKGFKSPEQKSIVEQKYYNDGSGRNPRYYQVTAINRVLESIANGQKRILLVMATGSGKTFTAFQIIWRFWNNRKEHDKTRSPRILFLADRNNLIDQTKDGDFKPFGDAMTRISGHTIGTAHEIYLGIYQAITGENEEDKSFKKVSRDFFDMIVVDECHRGSAREDSAWREILEYFDSAIQIGLTATPKETNEISNITYFNEPVFTYSLKQGIDDGFLAPYKVIRVDIDKDLQGWRPSDGQLDDKGNLIEDRIYNQSDMDRNLVLEKRTELVAQKITEFLQKTDRYSKTIVFCDDIDHAERMRTALINLNPEEVEKNAKYVTKITGDEKSAAEDLYNFNATETTYPVVAITSKLMTTGCDAKVCKLVVLDQSIRSMTEFKQIIGRGTRVSEKDGKTWFTIMDFKKATELFADKDFDGEPVVIYNPSGEDPIVQNEDDEIQTTGSNTSSTDNPFENDNDIEDGGTTIIFDNPEDGKTKKVKYFLKDVEANILAVRVQYLDENGKLTTESIRDYTKKTVGKDFASLDDFLKRWNSSESKTKIIDELKTNGIFVEALEEEIGKEYDLFDMICHIVYDMPPLTRKERANNVKKRNYFVKYGETARKVLDALLDKYADTGIENIEDNKVLQINPFTDIGTPLEIMSLFGGKNAYIETLKEIEGYLYAN